MFSFALSRRKTDFQPSPLGPEWTRTSSTVTIKSGPLADTTFELQQEIRPHKADFALLDGNETVGHCHFDRDPQTGLETLWDIFVHPDFRRKGLAALMVRLSFRELLLSKGRHWFAMRKLMKVDTQPRERLTGMYHPTVQLHNIGIGIICIRLGFLPEQELNRILVPKHVKSVEIAEPAATSPPGLLIHLNRLPGTIVAIETAPETGRAVDRIARYRRFLSPERLLRQARQGETVIGNIDYLLALEKVEQFARHLAATPDEYRHFIKSLHAGARKLRLHN